MNLIQLLLYPHLACPTFSEEEIRQERDRRNAIRCDVCNDMACCCFWPLLPGNQSDREVYFDLATTWWLTNTEAGQCCAYTCSASACSAACGAACGALDDYCNQPMYNGGSEDATYGRLNAVQFGAALGASLGGGIGMLSAYLSNRQRRRNTVQSQVMEEEQNINNNGGTAPHYGSINAA